MKSLNKKLIPVAAVLATFLAHAENRPAGGGNAAPGGGGMPRGLNISGYMMAPKATWLDPEGNAGFTGKGAVVESAMSAGNANLGLRVIHLKAADKGNKRAAFALGATGLVKAGDVLLSFRPEWDGTLAYAHMQLGISHAAMAFVVEEGGEPMVHSLESPLNYSSPLNSSHHYGELSAFHIIRPSFEPGEREKLAKWAKKILANTSLYGFYSDYNKPFYKRGIEGVSTPMQQIERLGQVVKSQRGKFDSYCSEFVWSVLGLRKCDLETYRPGVNNGCESPIFPAMTGLIPGLVGDAGLIQGPEAALVSSGDPNKTNILTTKVFEDILRSPDQLAGRMSSGHRAVAESQDPLMKAVKAKYYGAVPAEPAAFATDFINPQVVKNFSPTGFMVRSNAGLDGFKYVGTVVFDK